MTSPGGYRENCLLCPIARAINRRLDTDDVAVAVTPHYIRVGGNKVDIPERARRFPAAFDKNCASRIFSFDLTIPDRRCASSRAASPEKTGACAMTAAEGDALTQEEKLKAINVLAKQWLRHLSSPDPQMIASEIAKLSE